MNPLIKGLLVRGEVCILTDHHVIVINADDKEVTVQVADQIEFDDVAEMTLELPPLKLLESKP
jgi:hypothetical protein